MLLTSLSLRNIPEDEKDQFPWSMPLVKNFDELVLNKPITFFVGENGSGKSTFLEAIAAYSEVPLAGSHRLEDDESLAGSNRLADYLRLRFTDRQRRGFFVRAEDFIGFARKIKQDIKDLNTELEEAEAAYVGGDLKLILGPIRGERDALINRYSADLEAMSHGEGFLKFFTSRITGKGLYLIDEPEAALSPKRQLSLISLIKEKVKKTGSQFIIATHSPIMMSVPDSEVFHFGEEEITSMDYRETEHYQLTKMILDNPELVMGEL